MKDNEQGVFNYKYFSNTVAIYDFLRENYNCYFSKYLDIPSVAFEINEFKYEFYVADNDSEKYLYMNYKSKAGGGGYANKFNNFKEQINNFLYDVCGLKNPIKQMTIFDFM